jgi:hypothetical protein
MASSFVAYIDEGGDEGFKKIGAGSPEWFILSALVTKTDIDVATVKIIDEIRKKLSKPAKKSLHFRKLKHHQKLPLIGMLAGADVRVMSVLVHKPCLLEPENFKDDGRLYHYSLRLLLERLSWYCRDAKRIGIGDGSVDIILSNRGGMSLPAIRDYIDKLLNAGKVTLGGIPVFDIRLDPKVIKTDQVWTFSHGKQMGLQLADAVASSLLNAVEPRHGYTEDRYARMLKPITYKRGGRYLGYGLKFFPKEIQVKIPTEPRLQWVRDEYS